MELEEAIKEVESLRLELGLYADKKKVKQGFAVEEVLNHLTKQEKMIELMINVINDSAICDYFIKENCENYLSGLTRTCNICIREYFEKKVEESE